MDFHGFCVIDDETMIEYTEIDKTLWGLYLAFDELLRFETIYDRWDNTLFFNGSSFVEAYNNCIGASCDLDYKSIRSLYNMRGVRNEQYYEMLKSKLHKISKEYMKVYRAMADKKKTWEEANYEIRWSYPAVTESN